MNLVNTAMLTKANLEYSLCRFICEVKKSREEGDYPGHTLYQMTCALQNHLKKIGINWRLVHGDEFQNFQRVLDSVMQERAGWGLGTIKKQAQVISIQNEVKLWEKGILGEDNPEKFRSTVLYLISVNCALRAGDEHHTLRRPGGCTPFQSTIESDEFGVNCIVYREDFITKKNRGGLKDMKKERKIVWIKPNVNLVRCPVHIIQKYMSLLPRESA